MLAWLAGIGIISWRSVRQYKMPPVPGQLLGASGIFALLALAAEYQPAASTAALLGWGYDLAALLKPGVIPALAGGTKTAAGTTQAAGATTAGGRG
jgi:hypothetical protein